MLLGFKKQFVPKIESGSKGFTLRDQPKRMPKIGETLHMYTGLRQKGAQLITREHKLLGIEDVHIEIGHSRVFGFWICIIKVNKVELTVEETRMFMIMDGFENVHEFIKYWTDGFKILELEKSMKMFRWQKLPFKH